MALPSFGQAEVIEAMDALLSGWLTMGNRVFEFERRWAEYIGTTEAIAVIRFIRSIGDVICYDRVRIFEAWTRGNRPRLLGGLRLCFPSLKPG